MRRTFLVTTPLPFSRPPSANQHHPCPNRETILPATQRSSAPFAPRGAPPSPSTVSTDTDGPRVLTQVEIDKDIASIRRPRLAALRMSGPEKGIILGLFSEHNFPNKPKTELDALCKIIAEKIASPAMMNVQQKIKHKLCDQHIISYWEGDVQPMMENERKSMPYYRDDNGVTERGSNGKPLLMRTRLNTRRKVHLDARHISLTLLTYMKPTRRSQRRQPMSLRRKWTRCV